MTMIAHRCKNCGHLDIHGHGTRQVRKPCSQGYCRTCPPTRPCDYGTPEVLDTFDGAGNVQDSWIPPGSGEPRGIETCGCGACAELYEVLTDSRAS
jgi:hypothetical protein